MSALRIHHSVIFRLLYMSDLEFNLNMVHNEYMAQRRSSLSAVTTQAFEKGLVDRILANITYIHPASSCQQH